MKILILIFVFIYSFAEIINFSNIKPYYYENQIVNLNAKIILQKPLDLKVIPSSNIEYNLSKITPYLYDLNITFYANNKDHKIILIAKKFYKEIDLNTLIKIKPLPPAPKNFCNIIDNNLTIINPISSKYNNKILLSFTIKCNNCNIKDFDLNSTEKNLTIISNKKATFYLTLLKQTTKYSFYYFNPSTKTYHKITIPIILKENTISTQTNLTPEEDKFFTPFNILILSIIAIFLIIFLIYQRVLILFVPIILAIYLVLKIIPKGDIILKRNAKITILPTTQSTIIYISKGNEKAKVLYKGKNYTKIEINKKIGWVKNEDIK